MRCSTVIIRLILLAGFLFGLPTVLTPTLFAGNCTGFYLGDVDGDCHVGLGDLGILAQYWIDAAPCSDYTCGDLDESGSVDIVDFSILASQWQQNITVVINEFLASNDSGGIVDEDGSSSDWIELHNYASYPVNLNGWYLTDDDGNLDKWQLPDITLAAD